MIIVLELLQGSQFPSAGVLVCHGLSDLNIELVVGPGGIAQTSEIWIGIEKTNNSSWKHVPVPVPVELPYPGVVPDFEIDWETVGEVVIIATAVYTVIYIGAAIYTGGGSVVVLPPPPVPA